MQSIYSNITKILWASTGVLVLTMVHHVYGAIIYDTPFRLHITYFVLPVLLVLVISHHISQKQTSSRYGRAAFWVFVIITFLVPVVLFGIIEGGYNHLLKNILFLSGASQSVLDGFFPPPTYEMPDDFWFETTGILQFAIGIYTGYHLTKLKF